MGPGDRVLGFLGECDARLLPLPIDYCEGGGGALKESRCALGLCYPSVTQFYSHCQCGNSNNSRLSGWEPASGSPGANWSHAVLGVTLATEGGKALQAGHVATLTINFALPNGSAPIMQPYLGGYLPGCAFFCACACPFFLRPLPTLTCFQPMGCTQRCFERTGCTFSIYTVTPAAAIPTPTPAQLLLLLELDSGAPLQLDT